MDDFDLTLSPGEEDLRDQADRMKDYKTYFKFWKAARTYQDRARVKAMKVSTNAKVKEQKAKNKPILKFISTVGMLVFCMKFMEDHHTDKLTKDDLDYLKEIGKQAGLSGKDVEGIAHTASSRVSKKTSNGSSSSSQSSGPQFWNF